MLLQVSVPVSCRPLRFRAAANPAAAARSRKPQFLPVKPPANWQSREWSAVWTAFEQRFPRCVHAIAQFFDAATDFHCAVIAQKPPNFSGNFGHRIGRKPRAICAVKALYRLEQSDAAQLKQVLCLCAAPCVSLDNAPNQRLIVSDELFFGGCVAALRQSQQAQLFVTSVQNELLCAWSSQPACRCLRASERAACP